METYNIMHRFCKGTGTAVLFVVFFASLVYLVGEPIEGTTLRQVIIAKSLSILGLGTSAFILGKILK